MLFPEIFHRLERARWSLDTDIPWDQFDRKKLTERQLHGITGYSPLLLWTLHARFLAAF